MGKSSSEVKNFMRQNIKSQEIKGFQGGKARCLKPFAAHRGLNMALFSNKLFFL